MCRILMTLITVSMHLSPSCEAKAPSFDVPLTAYCICQFQVPSAFQFVADRVGCLLSGLPALTLCPAIETHLVDV